MAVSPARHFFSHPELGHSSSSGAGPPATSMSAGATGPRRTPCGRGVERQSSRTAKSSWRRRAGSARTSISTIFPCLTVKPMTANGRPRGATTTPAAPFTSAGRTNGESREKVSVCSATARTHGTAIDSQHDVRVEHREQRLEVTLARGSEEGVDGLLLAGKTGVGRSGRSPHPAARAAGELPRRGGRAPHDGSYLFEGHGEHVVQHER